MKRRVNFTGRRRIPRRDVSLSLTEREGVRWFDATLRLDGSGLPKDAMVYVEAYHKTDYMRYSFGTVGSLSRPDNADLGPLAHIDNLHFRVKVVDRFGRILAEADRLRPEAPVGRVPILPVQPSNDLGNQVWRLTFDEGGPLLELNLAVPFVLDKARGDPRLFFYVYPVVLREVLIHMVMVEGIAEPADPDEEWHMHWLRFATHYGGPHPDVLDPRHNDFEETEVTRWIETVVTEFCNLHADKWRHLIEMEQGET